MKKSNKNLVATVTILAVFFLFGLTGLIAVRAAGPATVNLGTAGNFVILSKSGITNVHTSTITGNIGSSPIAASAMNDVFCSEITGTIYGVDATYTGSGITTCFAGNPPLSNKTLVDNAVSDMEAAYTDAAGRTPDETGRAAGSIGGETFLPGTYRWNSNVNISTDVTLSGGANDVWIFQINGTLDLATGKSVLLTGGAQASNVFWQVTGATTLLANSTFNGNILEGGTPLALQNAAVLNGRALSKFEVTLIANTILIPTTLHLRKTVTTDNGGTASSTAWTLTATGTGGSPTNLTGTTPVDSGATFKADTYTLAESGGPSGYTASTYSCIKNGGGAVVSNSITLVAGDNATCTINNNDIAPQLTVTETVINLDGGTKVISDFPLFIDGGSVTSGVASTTSAGLHTVSETSDPGYTSTIGGDCAADGTITLALGDDKTCTITNDDIATPPSSSSGSRSSSGHHDVLGPLALPAESGTSTTIATALVSALNPDQVLNTTIPGLPNTGLPPEEKSTPWNIILPAGIFAVSIFFYFAQKKQTN